MGEQTSNYECRRKRLCLNLKKLLHADIASKLVQQFLSAGAVVFVKTNIPQTLFSFECNNPVWGRTTHPLNDSYSSGGSSGGEAVLLSMDGSAIGVGSDLAGSLRIPAAYCGIYSLKPSFGRISLAGIRGIIFSLNHSYRYFNHHP
jgi:Asp-tRNA(Asn)/Glu-tRNA(Gln) amidotransferase A subunit family amidase